MKNEQLPRVFAFSGGKTSAYMTIKYYRPGDIVIFCDTGREHPKTYKFINDFEAHEKIPVIRLKYKNADDPFREMLKSKNFKLLPHRQRRFCTDELKIKTAKRYLRSIGIQKFINHIGFRYDELQRVNRRNNTAKKVIDSFPLVKDKITKGIINDFWEKKEYNLEIPHILGNCTFCMMKGKNAILAILMVYPELADKWIEDENLVAKTPGKGNKTYIQGISIQNLKNLAQNNLFRDYPLEQVNPEMNCICGI